ncbi:hypothetical protein BsWGS_25772 [Bradybaena similaris]
MSSYHEPVRRVLAEFSKFLKVTLQSESLSTQAEHEKKKLLKLLQALFADYDSLSPNSGDEGSVSSSKDTFNGSLDDSRNTFDSHGSEEDSYSDNIADTTVKALSDPIRAGYLERKQEKIFTLWQKRYCVLHKNAFYIFKKPADKKQQGAFIVTGYEFREAPYLAKDDRKKELYFELVCPAKKTYQFLCETKDDLLAWKEVLQAAASIPPAIENDGDIYEEFGETGGRGHHTDTQADEFYDEAASEKTPAKPQLTAVPPPKKSPASLKFGQQLPDGKEKAKTPEADDDDLTYEPLDAVAPPVSSNKINNKSTFLSAATPPSSLKGPKSPTGSSPEQPPPVPPQRVPDPPSSSQKTQELPPPTPPSHKGHEPSGQIPPPLPGRALPPPPTEPLPPVPPTHKKPLSPSLGKILHPSEDYENLFYGKWDCTGSTTNELSFKRGQIVHVISRDLEDWWVGALEDKVGLVPKSYLCPAYELIR